MTEAILSDRAANIWVYLSTSPLLWLTATLAAYALAERLAVLCKRHPLVNPVALAAAALIALLSLTATRYETYFAGAQFIHFLLGPATVCLAIPLYRNFDRILAALAPMASALVCGSAVAVLSAVFIAEGFGAPRALVISLAPKSVTAPIAMSLSEAAGGEATLTAALVIVTGVFGAMILSPLMRAARITDRAAIGFAAGLAAHGIGTARALQINSLAGAFAGIAMGLNGALTAAALPSVLSWIGL